ncbi:hypothetical protein IEQ34_011815 [Dendrobium chrysotoxum]|uniref:Secreted protein n=1 Tax=Dendrobium chrysotoxum TaxID=161865 RepID=A0AAV7GQT4_DENCH|nr:hypothetical protein IEQ34_011815 [Dendrobium chrysotoxum]
MKKIRREKIKKTHKNGIWNFPPVRFAVVLFAAVELSTAGGMANDGERERKSSEMRTASASATTEVCLPPPTWRSEIGAAPGEVPGRKPHGRARPHAVYFSFSSRGDKSEREGKKCYSPLSFFPFPEPSAIGE